MRKYLSPLTKELAPDNWKDKINLKELTLDEMTDLLDDFRKMESFGKKLAGFMKEAVHARIPKGQTEYRVKHFEIEIEHVVRKAGLDEDKIKEEQGEDWVEEHRKPPIEYDTIKLKRIEGESP